MSKIYFTYCIHPYIISYSKQVRVKCVRGKTKRKTRISVDNRGTGTH